MQGFGTVSVVKINASWYTPLERGMLSGIYSVLLTSGYYMALSGCPLIVSSLGFEYTFILPAFGLLVCASVMSFTFYETPGLVVIGYQGERITPLSRFWESLYRREDL